MTRDWPRVWAKDRRASLLACTGIIEKALGRQDGVEKVAVSLTHEQDLIEYDPEPATREQLVGTLRDIRHTVRDPRKTRIFEERRDELVRAGTSTCCCKPARSPVS